MHLLSLANVDEDFILDTLNLAIKIKKEPERYKNFLSGKTLVMIFQKTSTRTRVSFEAAMTQLGGHAQYLDYRTTNFTLGEIKDEIRCIDRYVDFIMARVYNHSVLEEMAKYSRVPIINGLSDLEHPCQILADLLTIKEKLGDFKNKKIAFVGDGNNVCNSLIIGSVKVGLEINVATPPQYKPAKFAEEIGLRYKRYFWTENPEKAVRDAHIIYTDTWVSMGQEREREERLKIFYPTYQVNKRLFSISPKALFMHCLPAHRGLEVTDDVIDGPNSIVFDQAENRLHIQKAILIKLSQK